MVFAKDLRWQKGLGLSKSMLLYLFIVTIYASANIAIAWTISVYMVRDFFRGAASEQKISYLTGLLAASMSIVNFLTAAFWGYAVDVIGRKMGALIGVSCFTLSTFLFGCSGSYTMAILSRTLPCIASSAAVVSTKSSIGEACRNDKYQMGIAMSIFNIGWGIGTIAGPVLGGLLSYPCTKFKGFAGCHPGGFFEIRPFAFPCFLVGSLGVLTFLSAFPLLVETHPKLGYIRGGWWRQLLVFIPKRKGGHSTSDQDGMSEPILQREDSARETANGVDGEDIENGNGNVHHENGGADYNEDDSAPKKSGRINQGDASGLDSTLQQTPADYKWWKDSKVNVAVYGSGLVSLFYSLLDELNPIYASASLDKGGLALSLQKFSYPLTFGGLTLIIFSVLVYPWLTKRLGPLTICNVSILAGIPSAILCPIASLFTQSSAAVQAILFVALGINGPVKMTANSATMTLINLVATEDNIGKLNGISVSLQSGGRALGPILSGVLWSLSVTLFKKVKGAQFLGYVLISVCLFVTYLLYARSKLSLVNHV